MSLSNGPPAQTDTMLNKCTPAQPLLLHSTLASERYHQSLDFSESRSRHNVKDAEFATRPCKQKWNKGFDHTIYFSAFVFKAALPWSESRS